MTIATIQILGNVGKKPETKSAGSGTVTEFSLAVMNKDKNGQTTVWYNCAAWGKTGETIAQYVDKGDKMFVCGTFKPREYIKRDGSQGVSYDVNVTSFTFGGGNRDQKESSAAPAYNAPASEEDLAF
jgi:single-strand DNA-binding protein